MDLQLDSIDWSMATSISMIKNNDKWIISISNVNKKFEFDSESEAKKVFYEMLEMIPKSSNQDEEEE